MMSEHDQELIIVAGYPVRPEIDAVYQKEITRLKELLKQGHTMLGGCRNYVSIYKEIDTLRAHIKGAL
jgi:hypothetical protein